MKEFRPAWGTSSEIRFLENLGTFAAKRNYTPEELYERYIEAAYRRSNWGSMDEKVVIKKAVEFKLRCQGKIL